MKRGRAFKCSLHGQVADEGGGLFDFFVGSLRVSFRPSESAEFAAHVNPCSNSTENPHDIGAGVNMKVLHGDKGSHGGKYRGLHRQGHDTLRLPTKTP